METLDDLLAAFKRLEKDMPAILVEQTAVAGNDCLGLVDQRITETGKDVNGQSFTDYTPSYKKRKEKKGRYRGFVDFQDTTQMLASTQTGLKNINTKRKDFQGTTAIVIIGPLDEETRKKVEGNDKTRPGFLLPSKAEVERVEKIRQKRIEDMIREEFFA